MQNGQILSVKDLNVRLQIKDQIYSVVDRLSFTLTKGKTLAIVGESGSKDINCFIDYATFIVSSFFANEGRKVIYDGKNLLKLSEKEMRKIRGGKIAMIFQDPSSSLNPVYRIGDQLLESANLHRGLYGEEAHHCVLKALKEVRVASPEERLYDYPHQLSGGMKQRIMIAMALIGEPDILIADEPTTALDVTIQLQVLDLIRYLQKEKQMALLLITHDMGVVAEMADDCVVMYASQEMEIGTVNQIFDEMSHPYTMGLFNSRPGETSERGHLLAIKGTVPPVSNYPTGCRFHPRCPFVMERCKTGEIPNFQIKDEEDHLARCLLYDGSIESAEKILSQT